MRKMSIILIILATATILSYQNCAKPVSFSGLDNQTSIDGGLVTPGDPSTSIDVPTEPTSPDTNIIPSCANALQTKLITVAFNSTNDCNWGKEGNGPKLNGYMQARFEESVDLAIPANATLCDMEMDFPQQSFVYDDHVILTLNNRILMNTGSDMHKYLDVDGSGYIYDWSKLALKSQDVGGTHLYCNGGSTCNVPNTEQKGQILIDIPKTTIQKIVTMAPQSVNRIKMITTGDNDTGDCNHTPISFTVKASYHLN